jgi:membrane-associated protease RseP (regulator of RpoE activity)
MFTTLNLLINRAVFAGLLFGVAYPLSAALTISLFASLSSATPVVVLLSVFGWLGFYLTVFNCFITPFNFLHWQQIPIFNSREF